MENPPSIWQIIKRDHIAFWLTISFVLWLLVMATLSIFNFLHRSGDQDNQILVTTFAAVTVVIGLLWFGYISIRVRHIRHTLTSRREIKGKVIDLIYNSEDVWSVKFEYDFKGQHFQSSNVTGDEQTTKSLFKNGQELVIIVDPQLPS